MRGTIMDLFCSTICQFVCKSSETIKLYVPNCFTHSDNICYQLCDPILHLNFARNRLNHNFKVTLNDDIR